MTILHLRGTSGSGKSTIVREIMSRYQRKTPIFAQGIFLKGAIRKTPVSYVLEHDDRRSLHVIGSYENTCGGCDTIASLDKIYELVLAAHNMGTDVLFEGLLISPEIRRSTDLHTLTGVYHTIALDVPLDVCVASIQERRQRKLDSRTGGGEEAAAVNPKNTESKWKQTRASIKRLQDAGVPAELLDRGHATVRSLELLGIQ